MHKRISVGLIIGILESLDARERSNILPAAGGLGCTITKIPFISPAARSHASPVLTPRGHECPFRSFHH
jgi:hypothetical protein